MLGKVIKGAVTAINSVNGVMRWPGMFLVAGIVFVTTYEVFARYFFNHPTRWSLETAQLMQAFLAFTVAGWVLLEEGHIRVTMLTDNISERAQHWVTMLMSLVAVGGCAYLGSLLLPYGIRSLYIGEMAEEIPVHLWPFKIWMFVGFCLLTLQFVARSYKHWQLLRAR